MRYEKSSISPQKTLKGYTLKDWNINQKTIKGQTLFHNEIDHLTKNTSTFLEKSINKQQFHLWGCQSISPCIDSKFVSVIS